MAPYPESWFIVTGIGFLALVWGFITAGVYFLVKEIVRIIKRKI